MLLRTDFFYPREDHVPWRAFLGQPTILYGTITDLLADGLGVLAAGPTQQLKRARRNVHWTSPSGMGSRRACTAPDAEPNADAQN